MDDLAKTQLHWVLKHIRPNEEDEEHFHLDMNGNELSVSYNPPEGFPRPDWILREYSRGGFKRTFTLNESIDTENISAKYADGVLQVSLPVIEGKENPRKEILIN